MFAGDFGMGGMGCSCGGCVGVAGQTVPSGNGCCEISDWVQ